MARAGLTWGVERRLEFIEFRLFWDGSVNRADLIDVFGVSVPQASKDLALYQERAPGNAVYDTSAKRYVAGSNFTPRFIEPDAGEYLGRLRAFDEGESDAGSSFIRHVPPSAVVPSPVRGVRAEVLRTVVAAIREEDAIEVMYQSFSTPEPTWRWIAPHAVVFDGFRWHARAFDERNGDFRDFLLARILELGSARAAFVRAADDEAWHEEVVLTIAPHPGLSEPQRAIIALDYAMADGTAEVRVRRAFVYYTKKRLGLEPGHEARPPAEQQIVLVGEAAVGRDRR